MEYVPPSPKPAELNTETTFYEDAMGFIHAVNWTQPWLIILLSIHVVLAAIVVLFRPSSSDKFNTNINIHSTILFVICCIVGTSSWINSFFHNHFREFSDQDYFDKNGLFISVVLSAPLLFIGFFIVINAVIVSGSLLIRVKRIELMRKNEKKD